MRKFSKLLAVLLTVCVLCGVVASFAVSADDSDLTPTLGYATGLGTGSAVTVGGQSNGAYAAGINRDISAGYLHLTANTAARSFFMIVISFVGCYEESDYNYSDSFFVRFENSTRYSELSFASIRICASSEILNASPSINPFPYKNGKCSGR